MELYSSLKMFTQSQAELKAELGKLTEKSDMLSTFKCKVGQLFRSIIVKFSGALTFWACGGACKAVGCSGVLV